MKKIFILGTVHSAPVSKKLIDTISKEGIQVIIKEAVNTKGAYTLENIILEPFFMLFNLFWFYFPFSSKDAKSIFRISKECNIDYYEDVDVSLTQLIKYMHTPLNYGLALAILLVEVFALSLFLRLYGIPIPDWLLLLAGLAVTSFSYSPLMIIFKTKKFRDETMISNTIARIEDNNYDRILFSCGLKHTKNNAETFKKKGFDVEELSGYQHSLLLPLFRYLP